ncbi:MAG: hypothetical protein GEU83_00940 [Pseudonocardiaceae bacterium]|nr:hypothetical protein [Pseudonocardiaceae bacterium]
MTGDPLDGAELVAHWAFVYDCDEDRGGGFVSGQFLLRSDGVLLWRMGVSSYHDGMSTWSFRHWKPFPGWEGETDPDRALRAIKSMGYGLHEPGPTPIDADTAGPFPPERPRWL